ncbi:hypothetical protein EJ110_NYTH27117 [Nymphaea thermarum]|nr:hypothetical protein EJ110_NYTH27117 [Nymphaea thermarum]
MAAQQAVAATAQQTAAATVQQTAAAAQQEATAAVQRNTNGGAEKHQRQWRTETPTATAGRNTNGKRQRFHLRGGSDTIKEEEDEERTEEAKPLCYCAASSCHEQSRKGNLNGVAVDAVCPGVGFGGAGLAGVDPSESPPHRTVTLEA